MKAESSEDSNEYSEIIFVKALEINIREENSITGDPYTDESVQNNVSFITMPLTLLVKDKENVPNEGDEILVSLSISEDARYYNIDGYCESIIKKRTSGFSLKNISKIAEQALGKISSYFNNETNELEEEYSTEEIDTGDEGLDVAYRKGKKIDVQLVEVERGKKLESETADKWKEMVLAALKDGVKLSLRSAFRSNQEQQKLYDRYQAWKKYQSGESSVPSQESPPAARPGFSNHQQGLAVDIYEAAISLGGYDSEAFKWLEKNASRFSFENTVSGEPWHWEYKKEV